MILESGDPCKIIMFSAERHLNAVRIAAEVLLQNEFMHFW